MALTKCKECGEAISKKATQCPKCGSPIKKKTSLLTWIVTGVIALIIYNAVFNMNDTPSNSGPSPKQLAMQNTSLEYSWNKGDFDSIMEGNFTINNEGNQDIKDIEITCKHFAESGTRVDSNKRTIFEIVPAHQTKNYEKFNMGFIHSQATSTNCKITDLKI